jgi:hypothetical protein
MELDEIIQLLQGERDRLDRIILQLKEMQKAEDSSRDSCPLGVQEPYN